MLEQWVYYGQRHTDVTSRPEDPLRVLGEFLLQKSKELEGT